MAPPILSFCEQYPPLEWETIQEKRGEDSQSELWAEMTEGYYAMLTKAGESFSDYVLGPGIYDRTADDFSIDADYGAVDAVSKWSSLKWALLERTEDLEKIYEDEEPEEEIPSPKQLPVIEAADNLSDSSSEMTIVTQTASEPDTTITTPSTTRPSITWAPLPDTTKPTRKPSRSRRLRQKLGSLRALVCFRL